MFGFKKIYTFKPGHQLKFEQWFLNMLFMMFTTIWFRERVLKKDEVQSGARSLSIYFFLVYRKTDWQIWQTIMPPIIPSGMFIKIKLTIMGLFLKILSKNGSLIVLLLISHLLDRSFSNMLSLLNPRTQLQYSF